MVKRLDEHIQMPSVRPMLTGNHFIETLCDVGRGLETLCQKILVLVWFSHATGTHRELVIRPSKTFNPQTIYNGLLYLCGPSNNSIN